MFCTENQRRASRSLLYTFVRRIRVFAAVLLVVTVAASVRAGDEHLSLEDRVRYQRRIEEVYWRHRIWPAENPGPKPALDAVLPDAVIRERVASHLEESAALEAIWSRPLTGEQLQAEVNRMARDTKNAGLLLEVFAALDDNPLLVAECLARPVLVERLTRNRYANDARFHGALRERAEAALAAFPGESGSMAELGDTYEEMEWRLAAGEWQVMDPDTERSEHRGLELSVEQWRARIGRLAASFGIEQDPGEADSSEALLDEIPLGRLSGLTEDNHRFVVTSVLSKEPGQLLLATVSWSKRPHEDWWAEEGRAAVESARRLDSVSPPSGGYELPSTLDDGCTADTWTEMWYVPMARAQHTAVWTGTEMIVWGGSDGEKGRTGGRYDPATDSWTATSTVAGVPAARFYHTAIWTGTEMIVWGGHNGWNQMNSGGRYDPTTDSWTATATGAGVPAARDRHTAVWTGTEMLVWGGYDGDYLNTGGRYDPVTDSWMATSTAVGVPTGRNYHTAVWTGAEMIVWGGRDGPWVGDLQDTGARYDPGTDGWTATSNSFGTPAERSGHVAVWTGEEMIVWGGSRYDAGEYVELDTGGRYDPATDGWTATSTGAFVPAARTGHEAVWTGVSMIVWGGFDEEGETLNTGGRYHPATDYWKETSRDPGVPIDRQFHTLVWTGTEMIVWGGHSDSGSGGVQLTGGRYDPATDSWTATSTGGGVPAERDYHTAVWTGAEMIVWGGRDRAVWNTGGQYDPATDSWTETSTATGVPAGRFHHTAVWTGTEMIVWGGFKEGFMNSGGRYDPVNDSWTATSMDAGVPVERQDHTAVWTGAEMIVWGGTNNVSPYRQNTGGAYDPATDSWRETSTGAGLPDRRYRHTAVWTGAEMIVWGGYGSGGYAGTGGRYDPATDSWSPTSEALPGRERHTAVWTGTEMVVWGGYNGAYLNTGGRYDPTSDDWRSTWSGPGVPSGRTGHTAVWTGTEMIVWGGRNNAPANFENTGGLYDPATDGFEATSTGAGVPMGRELQTAVWTGTQMIVWGGMLGVYVNSGGLYCACEGGSTSSWYPDADGDGYGVESTGVPSCSQPPGYVALGGDCDDANLDTHPGAVEINDGRDNQCPGDAGFGLADEITGVCGFHNPADEHEYSWTAQAGATGYEVARSADPRFTHDCLVTATAETNWIDTEPVAVGACHYYLVRASQFHVGSWGESSAGLERTVVCP